MVLLFDLCYVRTVTRWERRGRGRCPNQLVTLATFSNEAGAVSSAKEKQYFYGALLFLYLLNVRYLSCLNACRNKLIMMLDLFIERIKNKCMARDCIFSKRYFLHCQFSKYRIKYVIVDAPFCKWMTCLVARWPKVLQNNSKGRQKISFGQGILVAVRPPIYRKVAEKGPEKYCLLFLVFFQGRFGHKFNILCCELGFITKYFLSKPWNHIYMTMQYFFCILQNFFFQMDK